MPSKDASIQKQIKTKNIAPRYWATKSVVTYLKASIACEFGPARAQDLRVGGAKPGNLQEKGQKKSLDRWVALRASFSRLWQAFYENCIRGLLSLMRQLLKGATALKLQNEWQNWVDGISCLYFVHLAK